MIDPSKMPSPKEALIHAKVALENEKITLFEKETLQIIKAAIPVAELHEQAVELLLEDHNIALQGKHAQDWIARRDALLTKIKVLKCTPPK